MAREGESAREYLIAKVGVIDFDQRVVLQHVHYLFVALDVIVQSVRKLIDRQTFMFSFSTQLLVYSLADPLNRIFIIGKRCVYDAQTKQRQTFILPRTRRPAVAVHTEFVSKQEEMGCGELCVIPRKVENSAEVNSKGHQVCYFC